MTTRHNLIAGALPAGTEALVTAAARCWRKARDLGHPVQQRLHALLSPRDGDMLAPVFDSLLTLCESALGRRLATGFGKQASEDEHMLVGLLSGTLRIEGAAGPALALDSAIGSTRLMLAGMAPRG